MAIFDGLTPGSDLTEVLTLFPRNSERLVRLLHEIMCADGELSRGEREAIAAFVSQQNTTPYCTFYHTVFAEVFDGPIEETRERIQPLLDYALSLHSKNGAKIHAAFKAARQAGWSENALYEVVEVCGIFNFVNTIVLAAGLDAPEGLSGPAPTLEGLERFYEATADAIAT